MREWHLAPFQRRWLAGALAPGITEAVLSCPRGQGKSFLAGTLAARCLTPGDKLFKPRTESVCLAPSFKQGRIVFKFARNILIESGNGDEYNFRDSSTKSRNNSQRKQNKLWKCSEVKSSTVLGLGADTNLMH